MSEFDYPVSNVSADGTIRQRGYVQQTPRAAGWRVVLILVGVAGSVRSDSSDTRRERPRFLKESAQTALWAGCPQSVPGGRFPHSHENWLTINCRSQRYL